MGQVEHRSPTYDQLLSSLLGSLEFCVNLRDINSPHRPTNFLSASCYTEVDGLATSWACAADRDTALPTKLQGFTNGIVGTTLPQVIHEVSTSDSAAGCSVQLGFGERLRHADHSTKI